MGKLQEHVVTNEDGAIYVGQARVPMQSIVIAFNRGDSRESILSQYVELTLDELNSAVSYYKANRAEVRDYMKRQEALWNALKKRADADPPPVVKRLRALKAARARAK